MVNLISTTIYENIIYLHVVVLIAILSSFIWLIKKRKYDGAIALFIVAVVYVVFAFIL